MLNAFRVSMIGKALEISFNSHTPLLSCCGIYLGLLQPAQAAAGNGVIFISLETQNSDDFRK